MIITILHGTTEKNLNIFVVLIKIWLIFKQTKVWGKLEGMDGNIFYYTLAT